MLDLSAAHTPADMLGDPGSGVAVVAAPKRVVMRAHEGAVFDGLVDADRDLLFAVDPFPPQRPLLSGLLATKDR